MSVHLGDYTPSNAGPWRRVTCDCGCEEQHIMPEFDPEHALAWHCWCHPVVTFDKYGIITNHNVAQ